MFKKTAFLFAALALCFIISGCGDDDCNPVSNDTKPALLVRGYATVGPSLWNYFRVYGLNSVLPEVDSIKVGDSLCEIKSINSEYYTFSYLEAQYSNPGDSDRFSAGDSVAVDIFFPSGSARGKIELLDAGEDMVENLTGQLPESIPVDGSFDITWSDSPEADWYIVTILLSPSNPVYNSQYRYYYTTDTTYTIDGHPTSFDSTYLSVYVAPIAGPLPDENRDCFDGNLVLGSLFSVAASTTIGAIWVQDTNPPPDAEITIPPPPNFLDIISQF